MRRTISIVLLLAALLLSACGGPKADVLIFLMSANGMTGEQAGLLEESLQKKLGEKPTVQINASPIFNMQKMVVELAAGGNSIIIIPEDQFKAFAAQGSYISLDDTIDPKLYPEGVIADAESGEEHLFGIPLHEVKWFKDAGYAGKEIYAFIPLNATNVENAKKVMKAMIEDK